MKPAHFVLAACIIGGHASSPAAAQSAGVFVGVSSSRVRIEPAPTRSESVRTLTAGVFVEFGSDLIGLRPEIVYIRHAGNDRNHRTAVRMTEVVAPLLITFQPLRDRGVRPVLYAGPAAGLRLSCTVVEHSIEGERIERSCTENGRLVGLSAVAGGGLHILLPGSTLVLETRYSRGLTNQRDLGDGTVRTSAVSLLAGLSLPLE